MPRDISILPAARKGFLFGSWPMGHPVCFLGPLLALTIADCAFPASETAVYVQEAYRVVPRGSISVTKQSIQEWVERETLGYIGVTAKTSSGAGKALKGCFLTGCGLPLERKYYL